MPPDDEGTPVETGAPAVDTPAPVPATSQSVLDSPEYKELLKQNRKLARDNGALRASEEAARANAASVRQAAEAQQQAAMEQQIADILGDEGVQEWNAIAELVGGEDQVEAARRLKALMTKAMAQSPAAGTVPTATATPPAGTEGTPMEPQAPAAPVRSVDGSAPLTTPPGNEVNQLIGTLESQWTEAIKRNQDPNQRNRMTMRDRASALIGYLGASYLKAGARPKDGR